MMVIAPPAPVQRVTGLRLRRQPVTVHEAREKESLLQGRLPLKVRVIVGVWIEVGITLSWGVASTGRQRRQGRVFMQRQRRYGVNGQIIGKRRRLRGQ